MNMTSVVPYVSVALYALLCVLYPLILLKVVVDLAMPGPERLAGEGVLMGAVPIVSNR